MVIDDTWASDEFTQSAALALREAGASRVSIMVIARWINPDWSPGHLLKKHLVGDYDPLICPVTGGLCP